MYKRNIRIFATYRMMVRNFAEKDIFLLVTRDTIGKIHESEKKIYKRGKKKSKKIEKKQRNSLEPSELMLSG